MREFAAAVLEYKTGALVENTPVFNLALAQSYRMLDDYDNALWYYHQFLATGKPEGKVLEGVMVLINQILAERERRFQDTSAKTGPPATSPVANAAPATTVVKAPAGTPEPAPWYHDRVGWALVGTGALFIGLGGYLIIDGVHLHNQANSDPSQMRRLELQDSSTSRYKMGGSAAGLGALIVAIGVIRFSVHTEQLTVAMTHSSMWVSGRF